MFREKQGNNHNVVKVFFLLGLHMFHNKEKDYAVPNGTQVY